MQKANLEGLAAGESSKQARLSPSRPKQPERSKRASAPCPIIDRHLPPAGEFP